jgi:NAD(P)-dependent dehydrogenase (short-subunit alcohol dehydrogenase family)
MSVILITAANKGLGREAARRLVNDGHTVYVSARDPERGATVAASLGDEFVQLDVTDDSSVEAALCRLGSREGRLDVLINNAGIPDNTIEVDDVRGASALSVLDANVAGVVCVTQASLPLLRRSAHPIIVNVSSGLGAFGRTPIPSAQTPRHPSSCTPRARPRSRC